MSKTPFYKTGISNSPFHHASANLLHKHKKDSTIKKSNKDNSIDPKAGGKFANKPIYEANYNAMKNETGTYASNWVNPTTQTQTNLPNKAGIQTQGDNARFITGPEFENMTSNQIRSLGSNIKFYNEKGEPTKLNNVTQNYRQSQTRSKMHNKNLALKNKFKSYAIDAIDSNTRSFTRKSTAPEVKTST